LAPNDVPMELLMSFAALENPRRNAKGIA